MQKIGYSTSTANADGEYTEGNPAAGVDATLIKAAWLNSLQREVVNVIEGAGFELDPNDYSQLLKAVAKVADLGFTPVQQGGGIGQSNNKIYIGWDSARLKATVDDLDLGPLVTDKVLALMTTVSTSDATPGKFLRVGDFGVGATNNAPAVTNANTLPAGGLYRVGGSWTGSVYAGADGRNQGTLIHVVAFTDGSYATQQFQSMNTNEVWTRYKAAGSWSTWVRAWNSENLTQSTEAFAGVSKVATVEQVTTGLDDSTFLTPLKLAQAATTSTTDSTPKKFLRVGDFGVGATTNAPLVTNGNTLSAGGMYRVGSSWAGSVYAGADGRNQGTLIHIVAFTDGSYATQQFQSMNANEVWTRYKAAGNWSTWVRAWNSENLTQSTEAFAGVSKVATVEQVTTGLDDSTFLTPLKLAQAATTSTTDSTPKKFLRVGDFGIGATNNAPVVTNANALSAGGMYRVGSAWTGSIYTGADGRNQGTLTHIIAFPDGSYATQQFQSMNTNEVWSRYKAAGNWSVWVRGWNSENLAVATEGTAGLARKATISEVTGGVDDAAYITPKKNRLGFYFLNAQTGCLFLPTWLGGWAFQWGVFSIGTPGGASQAVSFATPFPSQIFGAWTSVDAAATDQIGTSNRTLSGLTVNKGTADGVARSGFWFAIGA